MKEFPCGAILQAKMAQMYFKFNCLKFILHECSNYSVAVSIWGYLSMLNKHLWNLHTVAVVWQILYDDDDDFIAETYTRGTLCGHMIFLSPIIKVAMSSYNQN